MPEIDVRPLRDEDIDAWVATRNAVDPQLPVTSEGVRRWIATERTVLHVLGYLGGDAVGAAYVQEQEDLRSTDVAVGFFGVVASARDRGVGSALYRVLSEHARTLGKARLQIDTWEDEREGLAYLERRGFAEVERFARVRLDIGQAPVPAAPTPPGVEIVPLVGREHLARSMYETAVEGYADMPSTDPIESSFEDFRGREVERPGLRTDLSMLALAGGDVVGFGTIDVHGDACWHSLTAVRRSWRRRGVATAIKCAQIAAAKAAGVASLSTFSERRNTPMRGLNEQLGYLPLPDQVRLRGPLA